MSTDIDNTDVVQDTTTTDIDSSMDAQTIPFIETLPPAVMELQYMDGVDDAETFVKRLQDLVPKSVVPDKYEFNIPDSLEPNNHLVEQFSTVAKDINLTQDQASKVVDLWNDMQLKEKESRENIAINSQEKLQSEWGKEYESNLSIAKKAVRHFGGKDLVEYLDNTGMGNNIQLIKAFNNIGKYLKEDVAIGIDSKEKPKDIDRWNGMPLLNFKM